jgi:insertion element IS1 protein InsB
LFTGKDLTFPIEQDNSEVRHHLARFRRRSKVTSRARHMVDGALSSALTKSGFSRATLARS